MMKAMVLPEVAAKGTAEAAETSNRETMASGVTEILLTEGVAGSESRPEATMRKLLNTLAIAIR